MIKKKAPTISQSEVKILKKKAVSIDLLPSNSIFFGRYPYKVVFNLEFDADQSYRDQILQFKFDLTSFVEDLLKHPTRQLISTERPSLFIRDYKDLMLTLAVYKDSIAQVYGPVSSEHLDLLFSNNYRCQAKERLWYGIYDCKIETWLPIKYRKSFSYSSIGMQSRDNEEDAEEIRSFIEYIKDNLNVHIPKHWTARFTTTIYCKFDEFVKVLPFLKLSYPKHTMLITRAILNS
jgi:hypothetical protein